MKQDTATKLRLTDLNHDETLVDIALLRLRLGAEGDYNARKLYDRILTIDTARRALRSARRGWGALTEDEERHLFSNIFRLAILGLLVHPEASESTYAEIQLETNCAEDAKAIFAGIREQALELEETA